MSESRQRRVGSYGTSAFKAATPRFKVATPVTANVDAPPLETASSFRSTKKVSIPKAQDRFKTVPAATVDASTFFIPSMKISKRPRSVMAGGGDRFKTDAPSTLAADFVDPKSTLQLKHGPIIGSGPRFGSRNSVSRSSITELEESLSRIDFVAPAGLAANCDPSKAGGRVHTTAPRFVDPVPVTANVAPPAVETSLKLKSVPSSAALRSTTPRFEKQKVLTAEVDFFVPPSFVDDILQK